MAGWARIPNTLMAAVKDGLLAWDEFRLYCVLCYYKGVSGRAYPSSETLQELLGLRRQSLWRGIRRLEAHGFISVDRRQGRVNSYFVPESLGGSGGNQGVVPTGTSGSSGGNQGVVPAGTSGGSGGNHDLALTQQACINNTQQAARVQATWQKLTGTPLPEATAAEWCSLFPAEEVLAKIGGFARRLRSGHIENPIGFITAALQRNFVPVKTPAELEEEARRQKEAVELEGRRQAAASADPKRAAAMVKHLAEKIGGKQT